MLGYSVAVGVVSSISKKKGIGASLLSEAKAMHQYFYALPLFTRKKKRLPNKSNQNYEPILR